MPSNALEKNETSNNERKRDFNLDIKTSIKSHKNNFNKLAKPTQISNENIAKKDKILPKVDVTPSIISQDILFSKQTSTKKSTTNTLSKIEEITNISETKTNSYTANILYLHNRYVINFKQLDKDNIVVSAKREEEAKRIAIEEKRPMIFPVVITPPTASNWFLCATLSNNIAYVSKPEINNASLQYQFGIGYNINRNVSIQTGISFGNRNFDMRKDQFSYKGTGALSKYVRDIDADISLFEIPINLRYQLSNKENFGWFSTVGISSVFLKKENYLVTIDNGTSTMYLPQNFENTKSILSMLNLSLGYQFPISKKFTLTIEPYLQLPFKAICEGGSKISSTGLQIGGKYNFLKRK